MRYIEDGKETNTTWILICLISVFVSAAALLGLRLYASNLENCIADTSNKIEVCKNQNTLFERRCNELLSATNIFAYAKENLNMCDSGEVAVIHLHADVSSAAIVAKENSSASGMGFLDRFNPFVKQAHAKE